MHFQTDLTEDGIVVAPSRVRKENLAVGDELVNEVRAETKRTGSRKRLDGADTLLHDHRMILAEEELGGEFLELGQSVDGEILFVLSGVGKDDLLSPLHYREVVRLTFVSTIGTDAYAMSTGRRAS